MERGCLNIYLNTQSTLQRLGLAILYESYEFGDNRRRLLQRLLVVGRFDRLVTILDAYRDQLYCAHVVGDSKIPCGQLSNVDVRIIVRPYVSRLARRVRGTASADLCRSPALV